MTSTAVTTAVTYNAFTGITGLIIGNFATFYAISRDTVNACTGMYSGGYRFLYASSVGFSLVARSLAKVMRRPPIGE